MTGEGNLTMIDLFCGGGGSTTGAFMVPGIDVRIAANHWDLAIETHNTNYPQVDHLQADISLLDPRYVPHTDLAWISPECTNHSRAKGRRAVPAQPDLFGETLVEDAVRRSRATMWDVVRFAEVHRYRAVVVENVVEVADWGDDDTCRGGLFQAWLLAMTNLGYQYRILSLNSMHAQQHGLPAPQSRDRVYVVFWRKGEHGPDLERVVRPRAWCPCCDRIVDAVQSWKNPTSTRPGRYRAQYVYRCPNHSCRGQVVEPGWLPASTIINWDRLGTRIGDREKPLADKTMARIRAGIERYWEPFIAEAAGNTWDSASGASGSYLRAWPTTEPLRTVHTTISKALVIPMEGRDGKAAASTVAPLRTMTTRNETGIAFPQPLIAELHGGGSTVRPVGEPLSTVCAGGNHHALVVPYYGRATSTTSDSALPTVVTHDRFALIMRNNTASLGQGYLCTPVEEPIRTVTTAGHQSLLAIEPPCSVDDVWFRMLEPDEIKKGMAFPDGYTLLGSRRNQVRLAGNAVTPPAARDIMSEVYAAITGE